MWQQRPTLSRTSRPSLGHGSVARKERVKIALSVECLFLGLEYLVEGGRGETEETITTADYVAFFCQYLGYTDNPVGLDSYCTGTVPVRGILSRQLVITSTAARPQPELVPRSPASLCHHKLGQAVFLRAAGYSASMKNVLTSPIQMNHTLSEREREAIGSKR